MVVSWLARIWRQCSTISSPPALLFVLFSFVVVVVVVFCGGINSRTLIPLFMTGPLYDSGSPSWDDCDRTLETG